MPVPAAEPRTVEVRPADLGQLSRHTWRLADAVDRVAADLLALVGALQEVRGGQGLLAAADDAARSCAATVLAEAQRLRRLAGALSVAAGAYDATDRRAAG